MNAGSGGVQWKVPPIGEENCRIHSFTLGKRGLSHYAQPFFSKTHILQEEYTSLSFNCRFEAVADARKSQDSIRLFINAFRDKETKLGISGWYNYDIS